jgi:thymidylate synthase (FAD)
MKVELIDYMGSDLSVVNAARVSFEKSSDWVVEYDAELEETFYSLSGRDAKLIKYLAKHNHWTPFGHCYATFRIKAPIFVARQLGKHQVGLVWNEVSRRYVDSEPEFYTPEVWRKRAENVKQGSSDEAIHANSFWLNTYDDLVEQSNEVYSQMLAIGICPEQARMVLPQSMLTEWWWSGSLAAFARVCKLRLDPHTQKETRDVAQLMSDALELLFPVSWKALMEN